MTFDDDMAAIDARLTKLERAIDYIEKSVDLCVNALKEIARTHCPMHVADQIDCGIAELRKHRTDPAPPLSVIEDPFPAVTIDNPETDTPKPRWRKP